MFVEDLLYVRVRLYRWFVVQVRYVGRFIWRSFIFSSSRSFLQSFCIYIYTPPPFTSKTSRKGGRLCKRKVPGGSHPDGTRLGEEEEPRAIRHSYGALTSEGRNPLNESVHAVLPRRTCTSVQPRVRVRERVRRTPSPLFFFLFSLPATHESLL